MGFLFFLLVFAWAVVLPLFALGRASRMRQRAEEAEARAERAERRLRELTRAVTRAGGSEADAPLAAGLARGAPRATPVAPEAPPPAADMPPPPVIPPPPVVPPQAAMFELAPPTASPPRAPPQPPRATPLPPRGSAAEARAAVERYSAWREHVRPFLLANVGWFIGGFLIVAGSLYFLREAWGSFALLGRYLLLAATSLAYAAGFVGVALWLKRAHGLQTAGRAMASVGLALLPVAALAASMTFALRPLAWVLAAPALLAASAPVLYLGAGLLERSLAPPLTKALSGLLGLVLVAPAIAAASPQAVLLLPYAAWAVLHAISTAPLRQTAEPSPAVLAFHLSALAYTALFVLGRAHSLGGTALPWPGFYGPLTILASFTALRFDVVLRARWGARPAVDTAVIASFAAALSGIAVAARQPALLALSAALAAAHFAAAIAWYRRPLMVHFTYAAATAAVLTLIPREPAAASFALAAMAAGGEFIARRFDRRGEPKLAAAGALASALLLAGAAAAALDAARTTPSLAAIGAFLAVAAVIASWHLRDPRQGTAWTGAAAFSAAALFAAQRLAPAAATQAAACVVAASATASSFLKGKRLGAAALSCFALLLSGAALVLAGPAERELLMVAALWAPAAIAFGNAAIGLGACAAALLALGHRLMGPAALGTLPDAGARWALVPAAPLAAAFALRLVARRLDVPALFPTRLPWPESGLRALSEPLLACAAAATVLLALRGAASVDLDGARLLAIAVVCSVALASLSQRAGWSGAAAGFAVLAAAWTASSWLGLSVPALALGAAGGAAVTLIAARAAPFQEHARVAVDTGGFAASLAAAVALGAALSGGDARLGCVALAACAAALVLLAAPARPAFAWPGLAALVACAAVAPLALARPLTTIAPALAGLALALRWLAFALRGGPAWSAPLLRAGPDVAALAALTCNLALPGAFAHWDRALCDALLAAYLASALYVEGGPALLHLLLASVALGGVRIRALLGIVPSGWGAVAAAGLLLCLAHALRRREKYAQVLSLWSALAIGFTCASWVVAPRHLWPQLLAASLVAVPLAPRFIPRLTSAVAVAGFCGALLVAVPMQFWTAATWPLAPSALSVVLAVAALGTARIGNPALCAPVDLLRALRVAAVALAAASGGTTAVAVGSAALRLAGASPPPALAALPLICAGLALAIALPRVRALALFAAGVSGALALALPAAGLRVPAAGALLLLAGSFAGALLARRFAELRWTGLSLWAAAAAATHLAPGEWTTAPVLLAGAWFARDLELPLALSAPGIAAVASAGFALSYGASRVATLAEAGVAAPLSVIAGAIALFHERRRSAANAALFALAGAGLAASAALDGPARVRAPFLFAAAALLFVLCCRRAREEARWVYAAAVPPIAAWAWARFALGLFPASTGADAVAVLGASFALVVAQAALRESPLSLPLARVAGLLPAALLFTTPAGAVPLSAGAAAAVYGLLAWLRQSRLAAYAALALVNLALFSNWRGATDLQLYCIPLGLSLLAAAQISREDLSRDQLSWLRAFGCLVLYAGTAVQMMRFEGAAYPLILGGLALATVVAGVGLQVRAFALLGAATLVADLLANLARASAQSSRVMAVSATLTGFAILGAMVWLSVKREETLALYRRLVRAMEDWE